MAVTVDIGLTGNRRPADEVTLVMSKATATATIRATIMVRGVSRDAEMFRTGGPALRDMIAAGGAIGALAAAERAVRDSKPRNIERAAQKAAKAAERAAQPPKVKADGRPPGFTDEQWLGVIMYRAARAAQKAAKASNPPPVVPAAPSPVPTDEEVNATVLSGIGSATPSDLAEFTGLFNGNARIVAAETAAENGKAARKARRQAAKRPDGPVYTPEEEALHRENAAQAAKFVSLAERVF